MKRWMVIAVLLLAACEQEVTGPQATAAGGEKPVVYTVNYPLAWAAAQLAENSAEVIFPAPAGVDPAFWEPEPEILTGFQQADLVLLNGAGYAKWLQRVSLPMNHLVDTSRTFSDQLIALNSGPLHSHGPGGERSHGELAFTLWLDLELFARQLTAIETALARALPERAAETGERAERLRAELSDMDAQLMRLGEQLAGEPLLYSHPVYQYLQRRYALNGEALHWEPDQFPDEKQWSRLDATLGRHPARLMLWEGQPLESTRARLAEKGVEVVVFHPLGNHPESGDFRSAMMANIDRLRAAITQ